MYKFYTLNETIVLQLFLGILLLLTSAQNFVGFLRGIELSLYYLAENLEESVFWFRKFCLIFFLIRVHAKREKM